MTTATVRPPFASGNANKPPGKFTELPDPEFIDLAKFGKGPPAARLGDSVSHLSLIAVLLVAAAAVVIVVAVGAILLAAAPVAAVGGMIAGTVAFSASTIAAAGAIVSVTMIGGALLGGATADIVEGEAAESSGGLLSTPTGKIIKGATSVFINSRPAVPANTSMALCSKETPPTVLVAQGSNSVDIESQGAARNGDKTVCGAAISGETSPDVYIGGGQKSFLAVDDDLGFFRATFAVMKWTGAAAGLAAGAVGISAAFATGGFLAGVGALSEMAIGMFIVGPVMKWAGESGMGEALDTIGVGENSHLHRTLTELGGGLAELVPINLRSTKPSDRVEGSIREIELGLDKLGGKLFKFGTGKDFELPPALKAWNERVSSDLARRLGLDKAMLKANLFAMLHGPLPDDYVPALPKPDPIIFEMPPAPRRRTGFSDGSDARPSDYMFETVSGTITESGAKPSPGSIDDKPGLIVTLPDNAPGLRKQDVDFVSVKAPKNKSDTELIEGDIHRYSATTAKGLGETGDGYTGDHIPSSAASKSAVAESARRQLTRKELAWINDNAPTVVITGKDHAEYSQTYKGKNSQARIARDAANLRKAADENFDAIAVALRNNGHTETQIENARSKLHADNVNFVKDLNEKFDTDIRY